MATRVDVPTDRSTERVFAPRDNLPAQPTRLIGRERELEAVRGQLLRADVRLVTLTGPAGTGKTRLAIEIAARLLDDVADGAFFVDLTPIRDPDLVAAAIAQALDLRDVSDRPARERLTEYLRNRQLLLVLDNFEQVLRAAPQIADLLGACPRLTVLATSREPLHLRWEHEIPVPPLAVPDLASPPPLDALAATPAVALFVQRAHAVNPDFALDERNAAAVAAICVRLDGLPLAIELAAARSRLLAPRAILSRLGGAHGRAPLHLLSGGAADLPARQRTLRGAIAWSHDLLSPEEQTLFRRLAVFAGGCTLEAVEAVCDVGGDLNLDVLDGVASLVDKNLLRRRDGPDGEPRLTMLETIREFALERLAASGERAALQQRHALYFLEVARRAGPMMIGPEQPATLARLEREHDNMRAALAWSRTCPDDGATCLRLAGALGPFWVMRGYLREGHSWLEQALAHSGSAGHALSRANALLGLGMIASNQGDLTTGRSTLTESAAIWRGLGQRDGLAWTLTELGWAAHLQGDFVAARAYLQESIELLRPAAEPPVRTYLLARALFALALVRWSEGEAEQAKALNEESLALFRTLEDKSGIAGALNSLGQAVWLAGDAERAGAIYDEALALQRQSGNRADRALLVHLGFVRLHQRDRPRAAALFTEAVTLARESGDTRQLGYALIGLAGIALAAEGPRRAARLLGAVERLFATQGMPLEPIARLEFDRYVAAARARLDGRTFDAAWAEGAALPLEEAIAEALCRSEEQGARSEESTLADDRSSLLAPRSSLPDGLTPREAEVLRLLASGNTSHEIAETLVLSLRTVSNHIAHLYGKIGARNRAEATAYALRHGLL